MGDVELSRYTAIIVPGGQPQKEYYPDYVRHAARFDDYVATGGTLLLELNGAEGTSMVLPRGVTMTPRGGLENAIIATNHPVFAPFGSERVIRANLASHGYLSGVPSGALVLAVESKGSERFNDRPTFVEYPHGQGRVIAACQCLHDVDNSGRGPLMATVLDYAAAGVMGDLAEAWLFGESLDEIAQFNARISGVTAAEIQSIARESFNPARRVEGLIRGAGKKV